jgi:hypothetical protein
MDFEIESGIIDQRVPFYVGLPGLIALGAGFTVYRQRGTGNAATMTTPDIVEDPSIPGYYRLLVDEGTTITAGRTTECMTLVVQHAALGGEPIILKGQLYTNLKADVRAVLGSPLVVGGSAPVSPVGI